MLFKNSKLNRLIIVAILAIITIPLLNIFVVFPQFKKLDVHNIEKSAIYLAQHMENHLRESENWSLVMNGGELSTQEREILSGYLADFKLEKMKVFTAKGLAVYSTDPEDIGKLNDRNYFHDIVAKGDVYSKVVQKKTKSLENQIYKADVVEVYVPSMQGDRFNGAFELYYNITSSLNALERLIYYSSLIPLVIASILLALLIWGMLNLERSLIATKHAEEEVKSLQGIIPICGYCKEIRNDQGAWTRLENYIENHSEARFSHGICDGCMADRFGERISKK